MIELGVAQVEPVAWGSVVVEDALLGAVVFLASGARRLVEERWSHLKDFRAWALGIAAILSGADIESHLDVGRWLAGWVNLVVSGVLLYCAFRFDRIRVAERAQEAAQEAERERSGSES